MLHAICISAVAVSLRWASCGLWASCYTTPHDSGEVLWFHVGRPCFCPYFRPSVVRPSVFCFRMITWVNINGFSPNLVCALVLWRSGLGLLMGKFCQSFTELSAQDKPIFSFPDDNWVSISGYSPNLVCALILWRSGLGLLMGKFHQCLTELSARNTIKAGYYSLTFLFLIFFWTEEKIS